MSLELIVDAEVYDSDVCRYLTWVWRERESPWDCWIVVVFARASMGWSVLVRSPSTRDMHRSAQGSRGTYGDLGRSLREMADKVSAPQVRELLTTLSAVERYGDERVEPVAVVDRAAMRLVMVGDAGIWASPSNTILSVAWTWLGVDKPVWWAVKVTVSEFGWGIDIRTPSGGYIRSRPDDEPHTYRTLGRSLRELAGKVRAPEVRELLITLSAVERYGDEPAIPWAFRLTAQP